MTKNPPHGLETLLSVTQVATLEGKSEKTIRRLIKSGALPALRSGRSIRIEPRAVRNFRLQQQMT